MDTSSCDSALPGTLHGAFLVTARGAPGLTREQTRTQRFVSPSRGVRHVAEPPDLSAARAAAAVLATQGEAMLCGLAAARLGGLPLPPWIALAQDPPPVSIAVAPGGSHPQRRGVAGHRLDLPVEHRAGKDGLPVTSPARTWLDCAALIPIEHLVAMGDAALRQNLADRETLTATVAWARRRRGVVNARRALPILDARAASPGESIVRAHLVLDGLPRPTCNAEIIVNGEWLARADLLWPEQRVIVEYDGQVHLEERQRRIDAARRNLLQEAGYLVIVFTAADLRHPWQMSAYVRSALRSRPPVR